MRYFEEARRLWQTAVPPQGQAHTVQGELLRAVEKLRDEARRNGNSNWDDGHAILVEFLRDTLMGADVFDPTAQDEITKDLARIAQVDPPETSDVPYDRLTDRVIEWCHAHPEPVPHRHNPRLRR